MKSKLIIIVIAILGFGSVIAANDYGILGKRFFSIGVFATENDIFLNKSLGYNASFNIPLQKNLDLNLGFTYSSFEMDFPVTILNSYGQIYTKSIDNFESISKSLELAMVYRVFRKLWVTPFLSLGAGIGDRTFILDDDSTTDEFCTYGGFSGFEIKPFNKIFLLTYYSRQYLKFLFLDYEQPPVESLHIMFGFWPSDFMSLVLHYGTDINSDTDSSVQMYGISCNLKI